jgi:hypothetical protein
MLHTFPLHQALDRIGSTICPKCRARADCPAGSPQKAAEQHLESAACQASCCLFAEARHFADIIDLHDPMLCRDGSVTEAAIRQLRLRARLKSGPSAPECFHPDLVALLTRLARQSAR